MKSPSDRTVNGNCVLFCRILNMGKYTMHNYYKELLFLNMIAEMGVLWWQRYSEYGFWFKSLKRVWIMQLSRVHHINLVIYCSMNCWVVFCFSDACWFPDAVWFTHLFQVFVFVFLFFKEYSILTWPDLCIYEELQGFGENRSSANSHQESGYEAE